MHLARLGNLASENVQLILRFTINDPKGPAGVFSLYIYFIFVDIFRVFLPIQPGRVFAGVFLQGFLTSLA